MGVLGASRLFLNFLRKRTYQHGDQRALQEILVAI